MNAVPSILAIAVTATACGRFAFDAQDRGDGGDPASDVGAVGVPNPPTFVQKAEDGGGGLATVVVGFGGDVTAGNLIAVAIDVAGPLSDLINVTDSRGDIYNTAEVPAGGMWRTFYGYAVVGTTGPATVTAMISAAATTYNLRAFEYTNTAAVAPLTMISGTSGTTVGVDAALTIAATVEPNELVFAFATFLGPGGSTGTGFTERSTHDGDIVEDRIVAAPGSVDVVASVIPGIPAWSIGAMVIRGR